MASVPVTREPPRRPQLPRINTYTLMTSELYTKLYSRPEVSVRASDALNTDTPKAAQIYELMSLLLTGNCSDKITQAAWPNKAQAQKNPESAQHSRMDDMVTVRKTSFTGAFLEELIFTANYIRGCLNNRTIGQGLKIARDDQNAEQRVANMALGDEYIQDCKDGLEALAAVYEGEIAELRDAETLPSSPGSYPVPKKLFGDFRNAAIDRLQKLKDALDSPEIAEYNNADQYHDVTDLKPELTKFQFLTKQQKYDVLSPHAELVLYQMAKPLHGCLDIVKCLQDTTLKHYLEYLVTTHMYNSYKNVLSERFATDHMLTEADKFIRLYWAEKAARGDRPFVTANKHAYKRIIGQYEKEYPDRKVDIGDFWIFPEVKVGEKRKAKAG
ncbi:hypothetical protein PRZ48_007642 [Zasmidium cellare]|uniref:Uncharacterized protein n=1 Tax=Zasmidium cellare TaxID=395010 RepID=A0ABR0EM08_ZASCE|nr:hypothetical protein PRZ48_007642 [Zasmidium cellare]